MAVDLGRMTMAPGTAQTVYVPRHLFNELIEECARYRDLVEQAAQHLTPLALSADDGSCLPSARRLLAEAMGG